MIRYRVMVHPIRVISGIWQQQRRPGGHSVGWQLAMVVATVVLNFVLLPAAAAQTFAPVVQLWELDGSNGFRIDGLAGSHQLGSSVAGAGDVNGDGHDDVVLGAPGGSRALVIFGHGGAFPQPLLLASLDGSNGFQFLGNGVVAFGSSVGAAGDVNGDGFADIVVGTPQGSANGESSGSSFVLLGRASAFAASESLPLTGTNGFAIHGEAVGDRSGFAVNTAGDHNGDGFDDLIIGAPGIGFVGGKCYLLFGHDAGFPAALELASLAGDGSGYRLLGTPNDLAGWSVSGVNDVNGDGFADVIVGGKADRSYLVFGKAAGFPSAMALSTLDGGNGFRLDAESAGDLAGFAVSAGGDINGDGFADLIVGAVAADHAGTDRGSSYVIFGHSGAFTSPMALSSLDGSNGFRLDGGQDGEQVGWAVSAGGDVNGDGVDDLLIGAPTADTAFAEVGRVYVVFGRATGNFPPSLALADLDGSDGFRIDGIDADNLAGFDLAGAGDVNGDGVGDLLIGAPFAGANGMPFSGSSYVVFGRSVRLFTDGFEP